MPRILASLILLATLAAPIPAPAEEGEGSKVLKAFLDLAFREGRDLRAECRFVGRLLDSVLNARATVEYKDPGLLRIDLARAEGKVVAVLDLNKGEGFYVVPDAGAAVRFRSKSGPWALAPGDLRRRIEAKLNEEHLTPVTESGLPVLVGKRGDGSRAFSLAFTPGYKSLTRFIRHRESGEVAWFIQFRDMTFAPLDPARFSLPKSAKISDLPPEADTPFDYLVPATE